MNITLAVLADYANVTREGKTNIMGIFDIIYTKNFPFVWPSMQLVMRFVAPRSEAGTLKNIMVKLSDADGNQIFEFSAQYKVGPKKDKETVIHSHEFLNLNNLRFDKEGDYQFSILVNEEEKATVPFKIVKVNQ